MSNDLYYLHLVHKTRWAVAGAVIAIIVGVSIGGVSSVKVAKYKREVHDLRLQLSHLTSMNDTLTADKTELRAAYNSLRERVPIEANDTEALIRLIAEAFDLEPGFVTAIAYVENENLNPSAIGKNKNGTTDRGLMQLNDSWFKHERWDDLLVNVVNACAHIKQIKQRTYWQTALVYNAGEKGSLNPSNASINYANAVIAKWQELEPNNPLNKGGR